MLNTMRRASTGIFSKALMLLLVISFGIWGVGDALKTGGSNYAAKVGGEPIGLGEFEQSKRRIARQIELMRLPIDPAQIDMIVLRQMIQEKLVLFAVRDLGLNVGDTLLAAELKALPELQKKDGSFSADRFNLMLRGQQTNEAAFLAQLRRETAGNFMMSSLALDDITPPENVLALSAAAANETRDALLVSVPAKKPATISDADLLNYYEQNKSVLYLAPERRSFEYVSITSADISKLLDASITDAMLADAAAAKPSAPKEKLREALRSEQRDTVLRTLTNTIEDEIAAGKSMAEAVKKAGVSASPRSLANVTAEDGRASGDDVSKTVAEQGFTMGEGEISSIITSPKGVQLIVSVKAITAAAPKPYDAVKTDVKTRLTQQLIRDDTRAEALKVKEALLKGGDAKTALAPFKINPRAVNNVSRAAASVPAPLQQSLFERKVGEVAGPLALPNGDHVLALVVATHHPKAVANAKPDAKLTKQFVGALNQDVQNRALNFMAKRHAVDVNTRLLQQNAQAAQ